jgi:hypothetical protein
MTVLTAIIILIMNKKFLKNADRRIINPVKAKINFEDRWFQVFDYLFRNYDIYVPSNNDKFARFIKTLEINQPEIFNKLVKHLDDFSAEKILSLYFENNVPPGKKIKG